MKKDNNSIVTFIKAIDKNFFDAFIAKGEVCMNTVDYFKSVENGNGNIGDKFELSNLVLGSGFISFGDPYEPNLSDEEIVGKFKETRWSEYLPAQDFIGRDTGLNGNIYSLFAVLRESIKSGEPIFLAPEKFVSEFTNHRFILFLDPNYITSRIIYEIREKGKSPQAGLVEYYPLTGEFQTDLSFKNKPDRLSYQREFRLYFEDRNAKQQLFSLGPMSDKCIEVDLSKRYIIELLGDKFSIRKMVESQELGDDLE